MKLQSSFFALAALVCSAANAEPLSGHIGQGQGNGFCAAWLDLDNVQSFNRGDRLCVHALGGPKILVRLLPDRNSPASPSGIEGGVRTIPTDGSALEVILSRAHPNVGQISVHACGAAFGIPFTAGNGTVLLTSVDIRSGDDGC